MIWKENGGTTELSPYFDELWQQQEEGKEVIARDKKELRSFYEMADKKLNELYLAIRRAKPITKQQYKSYILES